VAQDPAARSTAKLTPDEAALILRYLPFYIALDTGGRKPRTEAQKHFLKVCRGEAQPETSHEVTYLRYRAVSNREARSRADEATAVLREWDVYEYNKCK
jgi:uncharacterized protein YifE (UPF0438 family)